VKNILTTPKTEWPVIDSEPATIGSIYKNYVVILAAIGPVCGAIGLLLLGGPYFAMPLSYVIAYAVISYLMALLGVFVLALIIEALAPTFGGTKDRVKAFKVAAYASTAAWVAGIFGLLPFLAILALVGLIYSFYLMYLGLPVLMKTSPDKSAAYTAAVVVAAIVLYLVIGVITSRILFSMMAGPAALPAAYPG
jgi:hypothetical protein